MTVARADTPSSKTTDTLIRAATDRSTARSGRWDDLARRLVFAKLGAFSTGLIRIVEEGQAHEFGTADNTLEATVHVHDPRFYRAMALGGSLGAAEAYIDGQWSTDDLIAVCRIAVRNGDTRQDMEKGCARLGRARPPPARDVERPGGVRAHGRRVRPHLDVDVAAEDDDGLAVEAAEGGA